MKKGKILNIVLYDDVMADGSVNTVLRVFRKREEPVDLFDKDSILAAVEELVNDLGIAEDEADALFNKKYMYYLPKDIMEKYAKEFSKSTKNPLSKEDLERISDVEAEEEEVEEVVVEEGVTPPAEESEPVETPEEVEESHRNGRKFLKAVTAIMLFLILAGLGSKLAEIINGEDLSTTNTNTTSSVTSTTLPIDTEESLEMLLLSSMSDVQTDNILRIDEFLGYYNSIFADSIYAGVTRTGLKLNEVVSMAMVFNNYTASEANEIFNGRYFSVADLTKDYCSSMAYLTQAFMLENNVVPVGLDKLFDSDKAKEFYNKYNKMLSEIKIDIGVGRADLIKEFSDEVRKDFSFISGTGSLKQDDSYKLSVVPMVNAVSILYADNEGLSFDELNLLNSISKQMAGDIIAESCSNTMSNSMSFCTNYCEIERAMINLYDKNGYDVVSPMDRDLTNSGVLISKLNSVSSMLAYKNVLEMIAGTYVSEVESTVESTTEVTTEAYSEVETSNYTEENNNDNTYVTESTTYETPVTRPNTTVPSTTVPNTTVPNTTVPNTTVPSQTNPSKENNGNGLVVGEEPWSEDAAAEEFSNEFLSSGKTKEELAEYLLHLYEKSSSDSEAAKGYTMKI